MARHRAATLLGALVVSGCIGATPDPAESGRDGSLTVLAAASLQQAFTAIAADFERAHPGVDVTLSYGPSSGLAAQIVGGAPADVFAAASTTTMRTVVDAGRARTPVVFAANTMAIALPRGNPGRVTALADLARPEVTVAVCQPRVPCGVGATAVFAAAGVHVVPVTEENDVKAVLTKVTLGEVDAGIVYASDVRGAAGRVESVAIPAAQNATTDYPIAVLTDAAEPDVAGEFATYVTSAPAQEVLRAAGFAAP